jgi:hypothetical protein
VAEAQALVTQADYGAQHAVVTLLNVTLPTGAGWVGVPHDAPTGVDVYMYESADPTAPLQVPSRLMLYMPPLQDEPEKNVKVAAQLALGVVKHPLQGGEHPRESE